MGPGRAEDLCGYAPLLKTVMPSQRERERERGGQRERERERESASLPCDAQCSRMVRVDTVGGGGGEVSTRKSILSSRSGSAEFWTSSCTAKNFWAGKMQSSLQSPQSFCRPPPPSPLPPSPPLGLWSGSEQDIAVKFRTLYASNWEGKNF